MTEEQKVVAEIEAHIATLAPMQQDRIKSTVIILEGFIRSTGDEGALALALVGARQAAKL